MKNELRKLALEKRRNIPVEKYTNKILNNLFSTEEYKKSKKILCYYPLKFEADTRLCFNDETKEWFLPRVNGKELEICPYDIKKLKCGSFNITEPDTEKINSLELLDMIIIPAVAADRNGYRLGYGKGYYDRFLKYVNKETLKVILIYSDLLFPDIYPDVYDEKADIIITDKEILRI